MARLGRRVAVGGGGGRRGPGSGFVPGSTENITVDWRRTVANLWSQMNAEQKQSMMKPVNDSSGVDPKRATSITPLACAVLRGKAIAVKYLLDKGADPHKEDIIGCTPLHYATKEGNDGLVRLLLLKGASVNASSSEGAPLHVAATHGKSTIVEILLQNNADPNRVCADIVTPMTAAVLSATASDSAALKCMKLLVKSGADLNCANPDTPLVIATSKHLYECVKYLLEVDVDANIPINRGGTTPIEIAADSGRRDLVEILFPHTSHIQSVSNWSVEGIIAHAKSSHSKEEDSSWEELKEAFKLFVELPYLPLPPAHHLSPHYHYGPVPPADIVPTLPPVHHLAMSPYYLPTIPAEHLAPPYKPVPVKFPKAAPMVLDPCSQKDLKQFVQQGEEDESQGRQ